MAARSPAPDAWLPGALAAAGVAAADVTVRAAPPAGRAEALRVALSYDPTPWRSPAPGDGPAPRGIDAWDEPWRAATPPRGDPLLQPYRLHVLGRRGRPLDTAVLRRLVSAPGPVAVAEDDPTLSPGVRWGWPLRLGLLPSAAAEFVWEELRRSTLSDHLDQVQRVDLGADAATCHLVVLASADDMERARSARGLAASAVLSVAPPHPRAAEQVRAVARGWGAAGYLLLPTTGPEAAARAVAELLLGLSRSGPLDVAAWRLFRLFPELLADLPRVMANATLLRRATVRESLRRLGRRAWLGSATAHAETADRVLTDLDFTDEFAGGAASAELSRRVDADIGPDEDARDGVRTLQARVAVVDPLDGGNAVPRTAAFAPDRRHEITVRIGPGDGGWLSGDRPFPVDEIEADAGAPTGTVALVLIAGEAEPQRRDVGLDLRPGGSTRPQPFEVLVRSADVAADGTWSAHLLAYHRGRLLDYARLTGPVAEADRPVRGRRLDLVDEAPVLPDVRGLDDRTAFDVSLTRLRDGRLALHSAGDSVGDLLLDARTFDGASQLSAEISLIAQQNGESGTRELNRAWRRLAEHGHRLRVLVHEAGGAALDSAERVQLVDSVPDDLLPLEFVFTGGAPARNARRCAGWAEALATGTCPGCPASRPLHGTADSICPLHFWGLGKVIERSVHGARPATGVVLRTDPGPGRRRLPVADAALVAVTDRVGRDPAAKMIFDETLVRIRASVAVSGRPLRTWRYWWKRLERDTPPLVLVIAHNTGSITIGRQSPTGTLSIGVDSRLTPAEVGRRWIIRGVDDAPVVLLLACNSVDHELPTAGFAARFRQGGAAIVVGSIADLWAPEAPQIAESLVAALTDSGWPAGTSVGSALLRVRRDLVAGGRPAGLGLAAFGDADWLLA